jgi:hypothetical protein
LSQALAAPAIPVDFSTVFREGAAIRGRGRIVDCCALLTAASIRRWLAPFTAAVLS